MGQTPDGMLVLLPVLTASRQPDGTAGLTRKFVDGVLQYLEYWGGPVRVLIEQGPDVSKNLDLVSVRPGELPFELEVVDFHSPTLARHLAGAAVAHGSTSYRQNHMVEVSERAGVPFVYGAEYTLKTRLQIIQAETSSRARRVKRSGWEARQELRQRWSIRVSDGIQCNGTPTFDAYRDISKNPLLYFDTRTREDMVIETDALERRLARLEENRPLRIAFSGRLNAIKGAHFLPRIAQALVHRGVKYQMDICGGGDLVDSLTSELQRLAISDRVRMRGVLDFNRELVPFIKEEVDLFVVPHVQGDPSCTYMETLACGVPIVGFDNEAFEGIAKLGRVGWTVPMGEVGRAAEVIARLAMDRRELAEASRQAAELAREHTFERTFERRVQHFRDCAAGGGRD